jgi:mitochondrial fission protein ELM1
LIDLKAITISEGAAGMRSQIEGLANLICSSYQNIDVQIKPFFKNLPIQLIPASANAYQNIDQIKIQSKVLVISCGKKSVKASIYLKKKFKGLVFNIHIQDPKSNHHLFDLIISPEHDQLKKPNNISTLLALHNINFDLNKKKTNSINFIIGGSNKYFKFNEYTQNQILNDLEFLSETSLVNVIPSRRTPYEFIKNLSMLKNHNLKLFTDLFDPVTYGNLLSESNMQIVTWDSISMISEAISSETGTFLYEFEEESCPKRYQLFHHMVKQKGFVKSFSRNMEPYTVSMNNYNSELKSKILNKIESNLWFKNSVS